MIFSGTTTVYPRKYYPPYLDRVLTPQQGLRITVTTNDTLSVYLLEVSTPTISKWVSEHYPITIDFSNVTIFEEFLEAHPESVGWQNEIHNEKIEYEYFPTKVTNATLVFSNPSSDFVRVEYEVSITSTLAPRGKVQTLAQWAIPIGFVLALPWLVDSLRAKTRRRSSQL